MTWDCFSFFNEIELLKFRLHVLSPVVDKFLIVETNWCHSGKNKPFNFEEHADEFSEFANKIIYVKIDQLPQCPMDISERDKAWFLENFQRNYIKQALIVNGMSADDLILISDLDEIPDPRKFGILQDIALNKQKIASCKQMLCFYAFNNAEINDRYAWDGTQCCSGHFLLSGLDSLDFQYNFLCSEEANKGTTPTKIRFIPRETKDQYRKQYSSFFECVPKSGWHFTYLMSPALISHKLKSFSHTEFNTKEMTDQNAILRKIHSGRRPDDKWWIRLSPLRINSRFPQYLVDHQDEYSQYIFKPTIAKSTFALLWLAASRTRRFLYKFKVRTIIQFSNPEKLSK